MDAVVSKCESFLEILQLSVSPKVAHLTKEKLTRAFDWAEYCQKVYDKIYRHQNAVDQLNAKLNFLITEKQIHLGEIHFTVDMLKDASHLLYQNFLYNPDLPAEFLPFLQEKSIVKTGDDSSKDFVEDLVKVIQERASLNLLSNFYKTVKEEACEVNTDLHHNDEEVDIKTAASLMRRHIETNITNNSEVEKTSNFIIYTFDAATTNKSCVSIILQSLLAKSEVNPLRVPETSLYFKCLLEWIKKREKINYELMHLPRSVVLDLVSNYFEIYRMYLGAITQLASSVDIKQFQASSSYSGDDCVTSAHLRQRLSDLLQHPTSERVRTATKEAVYGESSRDALAKLLETSK